VHWGRSKLCPPLNLVHLHRFRVPFFFSASNKPNQVPVVSDIAFHLSNGIRLWQVNNLSESACEPNWVKCLANRFINFWWQRWPVGNWFLLGPYLTGRSFNFISQSKIFKWKEYNDWTSNHFYLILKLIFNTDIYLFIFLKIKVRTWKWSDWLTALNPSAN